MRHLFFLFALVLAGCSTVDFVRKDLSPHKQGVLRYTPTSSTDREAKLKDQVGKKAGEFCAGPFEITKEYQAREDTGSGAGVGTGFGFGGGGLLIGTSTRNTALYNFVEFKCAAKDDAPAETTSK